MRTVPYLPPTSTRRALLYDFAQPVATALCADGLVAISGHPLTSSTLASHGRIRSRLFAEDEGLLATLDGTAFDGQRGYRPPGVEGRGIADLKRSFTIGKFQGTHPLYQRPYPELWPLSAHELTLTVGFYDRAHELTTDVVRALCAHMQVNPNWILGQDPNDDSILRMTELLEVPTDGPVSPMLRSQERPFSGLLGLIFPSDSEGLQFKDSRGNWVSVGVDPDSLILVAGVAMAILLNGMRKVYPRLDQVVGPMEARPMRTLVVPGHLQAQYRTEFFLWPHPNHVLDRNLPTWRHLENEMVQHLPDRTSVLTAK